MAATDDGEVRVTTDPTLARTVIEERDGYPAHVPGSEDEPDRGLLRVGFRDDEADLAEISWDEFSEEFAEKDLAAVYRSDGEPVEADRPVVLRERGNVGD